MGLSPIIQEDADKGQTDEVLEAAWHRIGEAAATGLYIFDDS